MYLTPNDILAAEEMISKSKILLCTYECPLDTLETALIIARKHNGRYINFYLNFIRKQVNNFFQIYSILYFI